MMCLLASKQLPYYYIYVAIHSCPSINTIDKQQLPQLNAWLFRLIYI